MEGSDHNSEPVEKSPKLDTLNDSNSLEPGEVVDDKTPEKNDDELKDTEFGALNEEHDSKIKRIENEAETDNILSKKPVLGKEKAKQRLKVIGIQKKIQMESRKIRTPHKVNKSKEGKTGSVSKKDKPITPHEKAKLTKDEIEKLKEKQDCAIPCLYYDATMIHHIRAECPEELSTTSNKIETCLTSSLEAIKNYEDKEETKKTEKILNRRRYNEDTHRVKRKLYFFDDTKASIKGRERTIRKLDRRLVGDLKYSKLTPKERDRRKDNKSINRKMTEIRSRYLDGQRPAQRPSSVKLMYTKTKPSISYAFNPNVKSELTKTEPKIRKERGKRKKSRSETDAPEKRKRRKKSQESKVRKKSLKKKNKKKLKTEDKEKANKCKKPAETTGALSFHLEDFFCEEEEGEPFSLCKGGINMLGEKEIEVRDDIKSEQGKRSPDTDEYMANWEEEEEDFAPILLSKDSFHKKEDIELPYEGDKEQIDRNSEVQDDKTRIDNEKEEDEIRDGLRTPIFVNPSPPAEYLANIIKTANIEMEVPSTPPIEKVKESPSIKKVEPKPFTNELIEMNKLYEQFIQSVNESGVQLEHYTSTQEELDTTDTNQKERSYNDFENLTRCKSLVENIEAKSEFSSKLSPIPLHPGSMSSSSSSSSSTSNSSSSSSSPSSSSSSSSSHSNKQDDDELIETENRDRKENKENTYKIGNVTIKFEDWKKLYALRKREKMLKAIHCEEMDEEDRQYLESLGKLIDCEKAIMIRKYGIEVLDEILNVESDDSGAEVVSKLSETVTVEKESIPNHFEKIDEKAKEKELNKIFDANRETIKLTIPAKTQKSINNLKVPNKELECEDDQDFTDKLLKSTKVESSVDQCASSTPPLSSSRSPSSSSSSSPSPPPPPPPTDLEEPERKGAERPVRRYSRSMSRSPELRRPSRKGRSLSVSPIRRSRSSTERSRRTRKRPYSPPPKYSKRYDTKRRKSSVSPLVRRRSRSRSPYSRRFSRSPPFRPPSPPPLRESRSPSSDRLQNSSRLDSPSSIRRHYSWTDESPAQYYSNSTNNGYYYPLSPNVSLESESGDQTGHDTRSYTAYTNYAQYNTYANDYMASTMGGYANNYGNEYISSEPMNSYSRIPVISSTAANYYYNEFGVEHLQQPANIPTGNNNSNNKEITQKEAASGKSTTVAVQKGNVLEIVPASVIPKEKLVEENISEVKQEVEVIKEDEEISKEPVPEINKPEEKRKKRKVQESWEDEVAKRHVISAVLRLNKEGDSSLRGILCNKINPDTMSKQKKKVLFADGIPPGKSSSTSDEEESFIKTRKCLKKRRRRGENKENESATQPDPMALINESKIDPELENAPPPAPPPGSPPSNLEQPVLNRPSSPEQLLYFHYDNVVNSMYVSQISTPIPPRLLNRNLPPGLPAINNSTINNLNVNSPAPSGSRVNNSQKPNIAEHVSTNKEVTVQEPVKENEKASVKPSLPSSTLSMPLCEQQKVQPLSPLVMADSSKVNKPASTLSHTVPSSKPAGVTILTESPPPRSPVVIRFSAFNQPPPRPNINLVRANFAVPPPNRPLLSHPAIPFGPQPPGGTANFNRNLPPNFNPSSPPPFRSSFSPVVTHDNTPAFSTASGMASSSNFAQQDNNLLPPPFPPKPIPSVIGQRRNSPQFHPNSNPLAQRSTPPPFHGNNNSNVRPPPPFHTSGIPPIVPRPNLGFPRSFVLPGPHSTPPHGPPPPIFNQRMCPPPNQPPLNMSTFPSRPMFQLPGGVHHFLRTENMIQRASPNATPPQPPPNVSPLVRHQGVNNL